MSELKRSAEALPRDNNKRPTTNAQQTSPTCCMCIDNGNDSPRDGIIKLVCPCNDKLYCSDCYEGLVLQRPTWKRMDDPPSQQSKEIESLHFQRPIWKRTDEPSSQSKERHHFQCLYCDDMEPHTCLGLDDYPRIQMINLRREMFCLHCKSPVDRFCFAGAPEGMPQLHIVFPESWIYQRPMMSSAEFRATLKVAKDLGVIKEFKERKRILAQLKWHSDFPNRKKKGYTERYLSRETEEDREEQAENLKESRRLGISEEAYHLQQAQIYGAKWNDHQMPSWLCDWRRNEPIPGSESKAHKTCQLTTGDGMQPVADGLTKTTNILPLHNTACCLCTANGEDHPRAGIIKLVCPCPNDKLYCSDCYEGQVMARPTVEDIDISDLAVPNERISFTCLHCKCSVDRYCFAGTAADMPPMHVIFPVGWVYKRPCLEFWEFDFNYRFCQEYMDERASLSYKIKSREQWLNHLRCEAGYRNDEVRFELWSTRGIGPKQEAVRECKEEIEKWKEELKAIEVPSGLWDWRITESSQPDGWYIEKRDKNREGPRGMNAELRKEIEEGTFVRKFHIPQH